MAEQKNEIEIGVTKTHSVGIEHQKRLKEMRHHLLNEYGRTKSDILKEISAIDEQIAAYARVSAMS